jgi:hypothetical protein
MTKRNRNIKNIFIMHQRGTNIMANQVKTPILYKTILKKCCMNIWHSSSKLLYLKNRIIIFFYFFISFCLLFFSFHFLHISLFRFVLVDFVSFRFYFPNSLIKKKCNSDFPKSEWGIPGSWILELKMARSRSPRKKILLHILFWGSGGGM